MATQTYFEIPLTPNAQKFYITLAAVKYQMALIWRENPEAGWTLDIFAADDTPLVQGIPLVTGADLLAQYPDLNFGGGLFVATDGNADAVPTYANLGSAAHLYFGVAL